MQTSLGPNTNAPTDVLDERCVLCAGEDRDELLETLGAANPRQAVAHSRYRSYEFWRFGDFCMILSGIGTGCLEPLLFEILRPGIVQKIVLIGTAGIMPGAKVEMGEACLIDEAWPAGTGVDGEAAQLPLRPRCNPPANVRRASAVSTDFYYGFSPAVLSVRYPIQGGRLRALFEEHQRRGTQLVDMESAQFYFFCMYFGASTLEYAALKAPTNLAGCGDQQIPHNRTALANCLQTALRLLGVASK